MIGHATHYSYTEFAVPAQRLKYLAKETMEKKKILLQPSNARL